MKVTLDIDNAWTRVVYASREVHNWLRKFLQYEKPGAKYRKTFRGYKPTLYRYSRFPTGYVEEIYRRLSYEPGLTIEVTDQRHTVEVPDCDPNLLQGITLRNHQVECLQAFKTAPTRHRGVICLPPGSGKTEILIAIVQMYCKSHALWLCPTVNVLEQSKRRLEKRLGSHWLPLVTFTIPQSRRVPETVIKSDTLIVDECHHTGANTWYKIAMECQAPVRVGSSATPEGTEEAKKKLTGAIGPTLYNQDYSDCYRRGILSRPTVRIIQTDPSDRVVTPRKMVSGREVADWGKLYDRGVALNHQRNTKVIEETMRYSMRGLPVLVVTRLVANHAKVLFDLMSPLSHFPWVGCIDGSNTAEEREAAVDKLMQTKGVLIASGIFSEGQDIPRLSALVNAAAGESEIKTVQTAGRSMRPETPAMITDFYDDHNSILRRHSNTRIESYKKMKCVIQEIDCGNRTKRELALIP